MKNGNTTKLEEVNRELLLYWIVIGLLVDVGCLCRVVVVTRI